LFSASLNRPYAIFLNFFTIILIYVVDLATYNAGYLRGIWIDACDDVNDIWKQIKAMLSENPIENSEEYTIHDYEGFGGDLEEARTAAEENYCGCYTSLADYAEELTKQTTQIPANLIYYIDYECMSRDMELNGDVFTLETGLEEVHIFWNH